MLIFLGMGGGGWVGGRRVGRVWVVKKIQKIFNEIFFKLVNFSWDGCGGLEGSGASRVVGWYFFKKTINRKILKFY